LLGEFVAAGTISIDADIHYTEAAINLFRYFLLSSFEHKASCRRGMIRALRGGMCMSTRHNWATVGGIARSSISQFVGRERELAFIWNQYKIVENASSRVVLLVGEQGVGKSRLLNEVARRTAQDGAIVLRGSASESEGMPPYLPFLEALGEYIRKAPLDQLRGQVENSAQILVSILPELALRLGELPAPYPLPPEQTRLRLYEAVGLFFEKISAVHTLFLTLDDLQWADSASLDLLCHVIRSQPKAKLLVLGTCREGEIERNPALQRAITRLVQQRVLTIVEIERLSAQEIEALGADYLGGSLSPLVSHLLFIQSEGNPFFAEELMQSWLEKGEILQKAGQWIAAAPLEHALPQSIVGVLRQRFTQLSSQIIDDLRVAAMIGRTFDLSLLAMVAGKEVEVLEEHLMEAVRAGLIRTNAAGVFTFSHDKIRESLFAEVSTSRRRRLHEAIGQILEARYAEVGSRNMYQLAELAFHFTEGGDRVRGVTYAQQAAEHALQSSAFKEAVTYYSLALELLPPTDEQRGHLLLGLGEAARLADAEGEAITAYKEALALFSRSGEMQAAAQAAHGLALVQWQQESLQAAWATLEQALALLGDTQNEEAVRIMVDLATLLTNDMDRQAEGMTYAQQALKLAQRLEDRSLEAAANRAVAGKLYAPGSNLASVSHSLERALELAKESNNSLEATECSLSLAHTYYWMAEIRRSYAISTQMIEFIKQGQQSNQLRRALPWLALLHASQGSWAEAQQAIEQAQPVVKNLASPFPLAMLHQILGFLAYQKEDYQTAEHEFQAITVDQQVGPERLMLFSSLGLLSLTQVALGKKKEAVASSAGLETLLLELPPGTLPTAPIMTCLALIEMGMGDYEKASTYYPILQTFRGQHYWFLVDRVLGMIATYLKDWDTAMIYLTAARETAQREWIHPELARTLLALADVEMARGGQGSVMRATDFLRQALSLFKELNLPVSVTHARRQLSRLSKQPLASQSLPADLTRSEVKVLQLVARGKSNQQIARELGISEKTVANHLTRIFGKTASENRTGAAAFAIRHHLA
jgi:predicted ATPase/DNA-binding NarL/FixJ family response regulator